MVDRVLYLGFEVRVELTLSGGEHVTAQITRAEAAELELTVGDIVWVRGPNGAPAPSPRRDCPGSVSRSSVPL